MQNVVNNAEFELDCDDFNEYERLHGFGVVYINLCEL